MKKTLRSLSLVVAFCLMAAFVPLLRGGGTTAYADGDFTIEDGVLTRYNGTAEEVVVPDGVTAIGANAFFGNTTTIHNLSTPSVSFADSSLKEGAGYCLPL